MIHCLLYHKLRPVTHWMVIQDTVASVSAKCQHRQSGRYMLPASALTHCQHTQSCFVHCSIYGAMFWKDKSSNGIIQQVFQWRWSFDVFCCCCFFPADVALAMLESEEKALKRRRMLIWSWMSLKISSSLRSAIFGVLIWGWNRSPCSCSDRSIPGVRHQE